ncbi:interferon-inducible GTPase 5-like isoform X2 [Branchiostoma floridae]|uniref:Interferon-inducible GTPase 5-like isoform X2 n=1 Tax=Branchiostoma floridae TaxID=7739 RepID=A0A9J7N3N2_BRAFL|nr:interferon-inducible GTPase 5-like isoform X2 [Branchiostoma floridae]
MFTCLAGRITSTDSTLSQMGSWWSSTSTSSSSSYKDQSWEEAHDPKPVPQRKRPDEVRIGVVGDPGAGKSTFINSVRGLRPRDPGAARVGLTHTTAEPTEYPHPDLPDSLVLVDFPGVLLRRHAGRYGDFNIGQYLTEFGSYMRSCDVFLVFCRGRIEHNPISIAMAAYRMGKKVLFVRSQFDKDVADKENDDPEYFDDKCSVHLMEELRQDYIRVLREVGWPRDVREDEVFIISGRLEYVTQDMWDVLELKMAIFGQRV